jgi:protein phosphatase
MVAVESAGITDVGKRRKDNEDYLFRDDELGLYIVADGMGGHQAGEVASKLVAESMRNFIKDSPDDRREDLSTYDRKLSTAAKRLLASIHFSNQQVHHASLFNEAYRGMGSTVSAIYLTDKSVIAANVGDSPIYLIRKNKIKLLSVTHTVMAEQAAEDPDHAELLWGDFKHVLTRAMGVEESVRADIYEFPYRKNDTLVISSDGLSDKAVPEEILKVVDKKSSHAACQALVDLANERGGDDNVTAIVLKIKKSSLTNRWIPRNIWRLLKAWWKEIKSSISDQNA